MIPNDLKLTLSPDIVKAIDEEVKNGYINVSYHPTIKGLRIYNYSKKTQFEHRWNAFTTMCRGLVVDDENKVIIHCPEKFFNEGEPEAPDTKDWKLITTLEKLDGYYISIRQDSKYGLIVTSRGSFDNKYAEAAKKLIPYKTTPYDSLEIDKDYFCELCKNFPGDEALIVTQHETPRLVLWSVNGIPPANKYSQSWDVAKSLTVKEARKYLKKEVEGVVVFDWDTCQRVKRKTEWYLKAHRVISSFTKKNIFEYWMNGESVTRMTDIPEEHYKKALEWEEEFNHVYSGDYVYPAKTLHTLWKDKSDKEFATECNEDQEIKTIVFAMRKGKDYRSIIFRLMKKRLLTDSAD